MTSSPVRPLRGAMRAVALTTAFAALAGCSRHDAPAGATPPPALVAASAPALAGGAMRERRMAEPAADAAAKSVAAPVAQRHLAVRHELQVEVPAPQLVDAWERVRALCITLRCEVVSSSLRRESAAVSGGASLELRVAPEDVERLLGGLAGVARVLSHDTGVEDKTSDVIDVEAHIRNRTQLRDSLRAMLADRTTKRDLSDLLEIQRTLADTQAELDSAASQRQALAQLTQMQRVQIGFSPMPSLTTASGNNPVARAWREAGEVLAASMATLITVGAAALPWAVAGLPLLWGLRVLWRRRRARRIGG
mgnify:CR=1 FL=1